MIYLSHLDLDPRSRAVRRDLADCHDLHRTILSAFPATDGDARERFGILHRLEPPTRERSAIILLVQSAVEPDWTRLSPGYLLDTGGDPPNPRCKRVDDKYAALSHGSTLRFRLRANPTRKIDTKSGPDGQRRNGRRVELRDEEAQFAWLRRKAEDGGFRLLDVRGRPDVPAVQAGPNDKMTGRRAAEDGRDTNKLTFASVLFDGTLVIADAERFQGTLCKGIGSAKAYGFGLLSVAPVRE